MTKARLPETDLARIAPLPTEEKWKQLRKMRAGFPNISYSPTRKHILDTLNAQRTLPMELTDSSRDQVLAAVRKACRPPEVESNEEVSGLLYDWVREGGYTVMEHDFGRLTLAAGYSVRYWANAILRQGERLLALNTDFRRATAGYSPAGQHFAFSAMAQGIREQGADFSDIHLAMLRFPQPKHGPRSVKLIALSPEAVLFSYDELVSMTEETLTIWELVCAENTAEARRRAANDDLPLFGRWA